MLNQSLVPSDGEASPALMLPRASGLLSPDLPATDRWATSKPTVALLSNDERMRAMLRQNLDTLGYASAAFSSAVSFLEAYDHGLRADAILLSFGSTDKADQEFVLLRSKLSTPIVIAIPRKADPEAARHVRRWMQDGGRIDVIAGDATDWELEYRVRALLGEYSCDLTGNAAGEAERSGAPSPEWSLDRYSFIEGYGLVRLEGREIQLKPREFEMACLLFRNVDRLLSREWLWRSLWNGSKKQGSSRSVDVCVANVRKKLELRPGNGFILSAVYGRGYRLLRVASDRAHSSLLRQGCAGKDQPRPG